MGLFGRSASESVLPFYQTGSKSSSAGGGPAVSSFFSRKCTRLIERGLVALFCLSFLVIFSTSFLYLPDISNKVQSVGKEFLVPDGQSFQIKRPRKLFEVPSLEKSRKEEDSENSAHVKAILDGRLHGDFSEDQNAANELLEESKIPRDRATSASSDRETTRRKQQIVKVDFFLT
jgi:hypothetical protein